MWFAKKKKRSEVRSIPKPVARRAANQKKNTHTHTQFLHICENATATHSRVRVSAKSEIKHAHTHNKLCRNASEIESARIWKRKSGEGTEKEAERRGAEFAKIK